MMEEKLMPMPENVIIKDPNLFERIRRQTMPIQQDLKGEFLLSIEVG